MKHEQIVCDYVMETLTVVLSLTAIIFSVLSFIIASITYAELKAQKNSTHSVQYVPVDELPDGMTDPLNDFQDISAVTKKILTKDPFEAL